MNIISDCFQSDLFVALIICSSLSAHAVHHIPCLLWLEHASLLTDQAHALKQIDSVCGQTLCRLLVQDTRLMKSAGTSSISVALRSVVVAIFGLVLMFITSVLLTALTLAILPVLLLSFRWYAIVNKKYTAEQLTASAEASTVAEECFGSIRTVSSFCKLL